MAWLRAILLTCLLLSPAAAGPPRADVQGDALPAHALARLGTVRWRHGGAILSLAFAPNGNVLASAGRDETIRLWDTTNGRPLAQIHENWVQVVAFAPDGKTLASGNGVGIVRLWEAASGREVRKFGGGQQGKVHALAFTPDGGRLVTASAGGKVVLWDVTMARELRSFDGHKGDVFAVSLSADGKVLASAGADRTVRLWEVDSGKLLHRLEMPGPVRCVALAPNGKEVASGGWDSFVYRNEPATGKELPRLLRETDRPVRWLAYRKNGTMHQAPLRDGGEVVALSPDGRFLASAGREQVIRLYEAATGNVRSRAPGHERTIASIRTSADGKVVTTTSEDGMIRRWEADSGKALGEQRPPILSFSWAPFDLPLAFSSDARLVAAGARDGMIRLWSIDTGKEIGRFEGHPDAVRSLAFSPRGRFLASGGLDGTVRLWEIGTSKEVLRLSGHAGPVTALAYLPNGVGLASGSADSSVLIWDLSAGRLRAGRGRLLTEELARLWLDLASDEGPVAYRAVWSLTAGAPDAVPFLERRLRPLLGTDARRIAQLIADLDDDDFAVREQATETLMGLGRAAEPALRRTLPETASVESRHRIRRILDALSGDLIDWAHQRERTLRALTVLEQVGNPQAKRLLEDFARGAPEAEWAREAQVALDRLVRP